MQNTQQYIENVTESAGYILSKIKRKPDVFILSGTGLGNCLEFEAEEIKINYEDIPHFPQATAKSHKNLFTFGTFGKHFIAVLHGRFHLYEGYTPWEVIYPIRVMQILGARMMVVTNSAGGINGRFHTGDIMVIKDQINLTGESPLMGQYSEFWGDMYPDMTEAYDEKLVEQAIAVGQRVLGVGLKSGVYVGLKGPMFETPAEVKFYSTVGGEAVGFSTVMEVIAAKQAQMRIMGLSVITNSHFHKQRSSHALADIIDVANASGPKVQAIVKGVLETL